MSRSASRKVPPDRAAGRAAPRAHPLAAALQLLSQMGDSGRWVWITGKQIEADLLRLGDHSPEDAAGERLAFLTRAIAHLRDMASHGPGRYHHLPVDARTFTECPELMNKKGVLWPEVMKCLGEINDGTRVECVLTGAIGVAKTTLALYTQAYQLYLLSCLRNAHSVFDLDPSSEILIVFQSISKNLAADVDYKRFRDMIANAPYFAQHFPFNKDRESDLTFPRRVIVKPIAGHDQAAIGQNVIGGILDEVNFMAVVEKSKMSQDGGVYDQAMQNYNTIARRRESRFMSKGFLPGMLCLVSSRNYPGQFTDQKEREARTNPRIYIYDKRLWDIRPTRFSGAKFRVFVGDETRRPFIMTDADQVAAEDRLLVVEIPEEYRASFENDILAALRDIAGVSTLALHPFMMNTQAVAACFNVVASIASADECDFRSSRIQVFPKRFVNLHCPRFAHGDIGQTGDSFGLAIGHCPGFKAMPRGEEVEMLPVIQYDMILEIRPPKGAEIEFENPRRLLYKLRDLGLPIKWVTLDSYQSTDTLQLLRQKGFIVGLQSMDTDTKAYDVAKQAFYDHRIRAPLHAKAQAEFVRLERDPKTKKIDHPPRGCFTGETRVALADGTLPTFKELTDRFEPGEVFHVYTMTPQGIAIGPARNPRVTKLATELVEVTLDNYQVVRCTPEHLFMTLDGDWIEAQNLTPDVSIMPLYRQMSVSGGWAGYERLWCPIRKQRLPTHQVAFGPVPEGSHVHHKNEDKANNSPGNLEALTHAEHCKLHGDDRWTARRDAMKAGFDKHFAETANRAVARARMLRTWAEGKFRPPAAECAIDGCAAKSKARGLCDLHYQRAKRARALPERTSGQTNHRVLSVRRVEAHEEVYDLTVPGTENFALAAGVFVHNSKDLSDAMAGVAYGLTMRRDVWRQFGIPLSRIPRRLIAGEDQGRTSLARAEAAPVRRHVSYSEIENA